MKRLRQAYMPESCARGMRRRRIGVAPAGLALAAFLSALPIGVRGEAAADAAPAPTLSMVGNLRAPFVENMGQVPDDRVRFYARTFGGMVYVLRSGAVVYALPGCEVDVRAPEVSGQRSASGVNRLHSSRLAVLTESFGPGARAAPAGAGRVGARVNCFLGADPARWRSDLPAYETVVLGDVGPGVRLELRAHANNVEKIFTVAPGADPRLIRVDLAGADALALNASGELEAGTALGPVRFSAPRAWQTDAAGRDTPVAVAYAVAGKSFGFAVGPYDPARPLVIDPVLSSTLIGGRSDDYALAMAVESGTRNIVVAGYTASLNFPAVNGAYANLAGGKDVFVAKFDFYLTNLLASTYLGGAGDDVANAVAIDTDGNIWVGGSTASSNFPAALNTYSGAGDGFVAKFNSNLSAVVSAFLGGDGSDAINSLSVAVSNAVYVAGATESAVLSTNMAAAYTNVNRGLGDGFVAAFSNNVGLKAWTFLGGASTDAVNSVKAQVDNYAPGAASEYVFVAGYTYSANFPTTAGAARTNRIGGCDAFVSKFNVALSTLSASTYLGGTNEDRAQAMVFGTALSFATNNVYVAGFTYSTNFIPAMPGSAAQATNAGGGDGFVVALNAGTLASASAGTYLGGTNADAIMGLALGNTITNDGKLTNLVLVGYTSSTNFPATPNATDRLYNGGTDAFVAVIATPLTALHAATYLGGTNDDRAWGAAIAPDSNSVFVIGATASSNFPVSDTAYSTRNAGGATNATRDGFITRLAASLTYGTRKWQLDLGAANTIYSSPCMGPDGRIYVGARYGLYAVYPDGSLRWSNSASIKNSSPQPSPAIGTNGLVYMGTEGGIMAVRASDGVRMYSCTNFAEVLTCPAIDENGVVYLGSYGAPFGLYRLTWNLASCTNWLGGYQFQYSSAALGTNSDLYVGSVNVPEAYRFNTINASSNVISFGSRVFDSSPAINTNGKIYFGSGNNGLLRVGSPNNPDGWWDLDGPACSPVIGSNDYVYVATTNGTVYKIKDSISNTWNNLGHIESAPALGVDGSVYVGAGGNLYSLNSGNNATNWAFPLNYFSEAGSPLVGMDGTIYIGSGYGRTLYAVYGPTPPDLDAPWPMFHHDMMNNGRLGFDHRPPPPTGLRATSNTYPDRIELAWSNVPNATAYEVFRSLTTNVLSVAKIGSTWRTNFTDGVDLLNYTNYYYWVKTKAPLGNSGFSTSAPAIGALGNMPHQPVGVAATRGEAPFTNAIRISWSKPIGADGYNLYRGFTTNTTDLLGSFASAETNLAWTNDAIEFGRGYYYRVEAVNASGTSPVSDAARGGTPPLPTTNVVADKYTANDYVRVAWAEATWATNYIVYTNLDNNPDAAGVAVNTTATSFDHYGLAPLQKCYYWVKTTNEFGARGFFGPDLGWRILRAPENVSATTGNYSEVVISWRISDTTNTTTHYVYKSIQNITNTAQLLGQTPMASSTSYVDSLSSSFTGTKYYYWVKAGKGVGMDNVSAFSPVAAGSTPPPPPAPPITATSGVYTDKIQVIWTSVRLTYSSVQSFSVFRGTTSNSAAALAIASVPSTLIFYDDRSAVPGTIYYYWIRSVNDCGMSLFSSHGSGWQSQEMPPDPVAPNPPAALSASDGASTNYVELVWSGVSNASAYEVWRNTAADTTTAIKVAGAVASTNYQDGGATPGVVYYYWVKSKTPSLTSRFSPSDSGFRAGSAVDIGLSDVVVLPTVLAVGSCPDAVSFRIANYGDHAMTAPDDAWVRCEFYLSTNRIFGDLDDVCLGAYSSSVPLQVRTSAGIVLPDAVRTALKIPRLPLGRYYLFAHVGHCLPSTWYDPVPANNTAMRIGQTIEVGETKAAATVLNDYNGDGRSDLAVYRESDGCWYIRTLEGESLVHGVGWGRPGYRPVVGDYDHNGLSDMAVYYEAGGYWYIRSLAGGILAWSEWWGAPGYVPVPGDYDGDGKSDLAVYGEASGNWYAKSLAGRTNAWEEWWGAPGYTAVPGDYDGDGKSDLAVYHMPDGLWYIRSLAGRTIAWAEWLGAPGCWAVPGDYDGDGISDMAVYHDYGYWFIRSVAGDRIAWGAFWGAPGYRPAPGDYNGDGIYDLAVYGEADGLWYIRTLAGVDLLYGESWGALGYAAVSAMP